jgi:hypothetical protein
MGAARPLFTDFFKRMGSKYDRLLFQFGFLVLCWPYYIQNRQEGIMGEIIHQSQITISRVKGPTRKAIIKGFDQPVYYGVHGGIKGFYKVDPDEEHAATLDHVVGAVGG